MYLYRLRSSEIKSIYFISSNENRYCKMFETISQEDMMERSIFSMISYSRSVSVAGSILGTLNTWYDRVQERRRLNELEPHMLKDIGLQSWQIREIAAKPFWRA